MIRKFRAGLLMALVFPAAGCSTRPDHPMIYEIKTNDYVVEFDGKQKRATIGAELVTIVRIPEDIQVAGGLLRVGPHDYGSVKRNDKISVVGGKVAVNGQARSPSGS